VLPALAARLSYGGCLTQKTCACVPPLQLEFGGRQFWDCSLQQEDFNPDNPWDYEASGQCVPVADINAALGTTTDINAPKWEAAVLVGFLLLSRAMVYAALRMKTKA
jgi:hypothetical protein